MTDLPHFRLDFMNRPRKRVPKWMRPYIDKLDNEERESE